MKSTNLLAREISTFGGFKLVELKNKLLCYKSPYFALGATSYMHSTHRLRLN